MRALVSGGGTAGHIHPALAVAAELASDGRSWIGYVGTPEGPESALARAAGLEYFALPSRGFDRGAPLSMIGAALTTVGSTLRAWRLLRRIRPDVVLGFGGYVALPLGLASALSRIPLVLHEQNSLPGLTNRILSRWARSAAVTYDGSAAHLRHPERAVVTGNPVRHDVQETDRATGRARMGIAEGAVMLFAVGGSRGARHLNQAVAAAAGTWLRVPGCIVVHVAGRAEHADVMERARAEGLDTARYRVLDWLDDMGAALAAADVVLSRAGATSIAEITALGRAAVLVPYPYATDDHQTLNARAVEEGRGAIVIADEDLDSPEFVTTVSSLLDNRATREKMAQASAALGVPDAARRVADLAREVV